MPPVRPTRRPRRNPRRRALPRSLRVALQMGLPIALIFAVIGGGVWLTVSGEAARISAMAGEGVLQLSATSGLRVENVLVSGRRQVTRKALERALRVERGIPIFGFDPHAAKARLETIPWVRSAIVERRLPDTVYVRIAERQPLALWQHGGQLALIDTEGVVLARRGLSRYRSLPLVVGADAPAHAADVIKALRAYPALAQRVHALVRVSQRRWDIRLENGIVARLPEKGAGAAMATLTRLMDEDRLFGRDVVAVDLRFGDRLVVRTKAGKKMRDDGSKTGTRRGKGKGEET